MMGAFGCFPVSEHTDARGPGSPSLTEFLTAADADVWGAVPVILSALLGGLGRETLFGPLPFRPLSPTCKYWFPNP